MKVIASTILLLALFVTSKAQQQIQYRITAINVPPTSTPIGALYANAVNDRGQVAGWFSGFILDGYSQGYPLYEGYEHPFLYFNGKIQDLGAIGGLYSGATAINNHGQVVGQTTTSSSDSFGMHPFLCSNGKMIDLGSLGDNGENGAAWAINDLGVVVGDSPVISLVTGDDIRAFIYQGGVMRDLGMGTGSGATGINNFNQVVGTVSTLIGYNDYTTPTKAFVWQRNKSTFIRTLGGTSNSAVAINDLGHVVGSSQVFGDTVYHAFLYADGKLVDLGPDRIHASRAGALNRLDQIVGSYVPDANAPYTAHAALWTRGKMVDLNTLIDPKLGWVLAAANGINDFGQIVGNGVLNGNQCGFLLTPYYYEQP